MKTKLIFSVLFLSIVLISCKADRKNTENETESKMELVLEIHDEVMPKMSTIGKLVGELKPKVDSSDQGLKYQKAMEDLQLSHKSMMDWMRGFGNRFDSDEILRGKELSPQKKEWLLEEEVKVKALRDQINGSIERAEQLLVEE